MTRPALTPARVLARLARAERSTLVVREPAEGGAVVVRGRGRLEVEPEADGGTTVRERGSWTGPGGGPTAYADVVRFTPCADGDALRVEHLRRGQPVFLVRLETGPGAGLASCHPHVCGPDRYEATVVEDPEGGIILTWTISGPGKDQRVERRYGAGRSIRSSETIEDASDWMQE